MPRHMVLFSIVCFLRAVSSLELIVTTNGPAVLGSNVTITAVVNGYSGENLKFIFSDNAEQQHWDEYELSSNISKTVFNYPRDSYESGEYIITVQIQKYLVLWYTVAYGSTTFNLTDTLNGQLVISQDNKDRPNNFVAVNKTVEHHIKISDTDMEFIKQNASSVVTHWFIDCMFKGSTTDFTFTHVYNDVMNDHYIEALVVADNEPLPPITTTTTTTTSTTTTTTTTSKPTTITTSTIVKNETNVPLHLLVKRAASNKTPKLKQSLKDLMCHNSSLVPIGKKQTSGYYQETIGVREPISTVNITGLNWLQHGDLLNLQVQYTGSPPFDYCAEYKLGLYNYTGNETCPSQSRTRTVSNNFPLVHYLSDSDQYTVLVIVENEIGKTVSRAIINIYKDTVHVQLSVIVVPVVFCLLAVILVVFGVAYYQHRARFTVEVADFDFGQQGHFDYKTFTERLRESFRSAFNFGHDDDDPLTTNTRYDSMT